MSCLFYSLENKILFTDCGPLDIGIMLDSSGSVTFDGWRKVLGFVQSLIREIPIGPSRNLVSLITFGNKATCNFLLQEHINTNELINHIDPLPWLDQWTNTSGAITMLRRNVFNTRNGDRDGITNIGMYYLSK